MSLPSEPGRLPGTPQSGVDHLRPDGAQLRLARPARQVVRTRAARAARTLNSWLIFVAALSSVALMSPDLTFARRAVGAAVVAAVFVVTFGVQRRNGSFARLSALAQTVYRVRAVSAGLFAVAAIAYFVPWLQLTREAVLVSGLTVAVVSSIWALLTRRLLGVRQVRRVLIVGDGTSVERFLDDFRNDPHDEYDIVGVLGPGAGSAGDLPYVGTLADLEAVIAEECVDKVVVAVDRDRLGLFARLAAIEPSTFVVQELPGFSEQVFGRVPLDSINAAWFMHLIHPFYRPYSRMAKRAGDLLAASVIGLLALPLLPFVALAVRLTSSGPALYSQLRVGEGGEPFRIYKFRSMQVDAERFGAQFAMLRDPRLTPIGGFLRGTRLDELPQLWNVLRGQMSFVGPRPERPEFVADLEQQIPYYSRRHQVKPGLTGWAQVRSGYMDSVEGATTKLAYELYYLKHRSLFMDAVIFLETVRVVIVRAGAR